MGHFVMDRTNRKYLAINISHIVLFSNLRYILLICIAHIGLTLNSQETHDNQKKGFIANGYDAVSYYSSNPAKGRLEFSHQYKANNYLFSSQANLEKFKVNPEKYIPQFGGWCAYAMSNNGKRFRSNPKSYKIINGKLYLFYDSIFFGALKAWNKLDEDKSIRSGNNYWSDVINARQPN